MLFVHRDTENGAHEDRRDEVRRAVEGLAERFVPVIPVRMTEAWLLHDAQAIRRASGNPNGKIPLNLPSPKQVEAIVDPKDVLFDALLLATELKGRRRDKKRAELPRMRAHVAELIDDFAPLESVPAFARLLEDLRHALAAAPG